MQTKNKLTASNNAKIRNKIFSKGFSGFRHLCDFSESCCGLSVSTSVTKRAGGEMENFPSSVDYIIPCSAKKSKLFPQITQLIKCRQTLSFTGKEDIQENETRKKLCPFPLYVFCAKRQKKPRNFLCE
uniref:Uncharacterized protein n=1 Tax=Cacopsylla melanoneura TaxID=428564 RepID=A0A8D8ZED3_9HEMI